MNTSHAIVSMDHTKAPTFLLSPFSFPQALPQHFLPLTPAETAQMRISDSS